MKKTYSKPQMIFESFATASFVAACSNQQTQQAQGSCPVYMSGMAYFTTGVTGCRFKVTDGTAGFCYYVPAADNNLFGS